MKRLFLLLLSVFSVFICNADYWTRKADFPGGPQMDANGFSVGNKAYILCGLNELWEYTPYSDTWIKKSNPPFSTANLPLGFGIGSYGYVFTDSANQFWQYSPITDTWIRKANLPGLLRFFPAYFVIGNKAYIGGGMTYIITDTSSVYSFDGKFYSYDPSTNIWDSVANLPYVFRQANGFVANDKGYVTGILDTNGLSLSISPFVFEYNPLMNSWSQKANFPGKARCDASTFSVGNIGYFGIGDTGTGGVFKDLWQYNAYTDTWTSKDSIPCSMGKDQDASFSVNQKGYICFGNDFIPSAEVWEYTPDSFTLNAGAITGLSYVCIGSNITLTDSVTGGNWGVVNNNASISPLGILTGNTVGTDTVYYAVTNSYSADTTKFLINILHLPNAGFISGYDTICEGKEDTLSEIVFGTWILTNNKCLLISVFNDTGILAALSPGIDTLEYKVIDDNGCSATTTFNLYIESKSYCDSVSEVKYIPFLKNNIKLYPNPATSTFNITSTQPITQFIITNLLGQTVYCNYNNKEEEVHVDVSKLHNGMYFITVNGTEIRKFLKQ